MGKQKEYITKEEFDNHLQDTARGWERLEAVETNTSSLEEEVLGNEQTGRKSLRMEFTHLIEKLTSNFISEQKKTRITVIVAMIIAVIGIIVERVIN